MAFEIINSSKTKVPILVSVPHCGTKIPEPLKDLYEPDMIASIDDTDWFVDQLYDFVGDLGITMIKAQYSRWLIDLNRNAESIPLYNDGRVITSLCPTTNFNNKKIYKSEGPNQEEINRRISTYYYPYYDQVRLQLTKLQKEFKHVLFFDAHSIRQNVPGIRSEKFPDLILGDVDEKSADMDLIKATTSILSNAVDTFSHNHPFKGGNLTRTFGQPEKNIHALQLEMTKLIYMDDTEMNYNPHRATTIRVHLKGMFKGLIKILEKLNQ